MVFKKEKRGNCDKIIEDDFTKCDMKTEHKQQKKNEEGDGRVKSDKRM